MKGVPPELTIGDEKAVTDDIAVDSLLVSVTVAVTPEAPIDVVVLVAELPAVHAGEKLVPQFIV